MADLLNEAHSRGIAPQYVRRLLSAFAADGALPATAVPDSQPSELVEPLSQRELDVLELIADGLSNRQIAERLYISLHTVKAHTRNIYGKLDVHSRTHAASRARELGVLPPY
jgi:LuxR family maltose regulon positive regulatory protein